MSDAELAYYKEKYESLCQKESELESKISRCKTLSAQNAEIIEELKREKSRLMSIQASKQVNINDIDFAAAHIERLWMQLEDHLSAESQFMRDLHMEREESRGWSPFEKTVVLAVTASAVVVCISAFRRYWQPNH